MKHSAILFLAALLILATPALGEITSVKGTASTDSMILSQGEECEVEGCKIGQLCFANINIQSEPARVLYEALKQHSAPTGAIGDYATRSETLACGRDETGYWCQLGYDALRNELAYPIYCQPE